MAPHPSDYLMWSTQPQVNDGTVVHIGLSLKYHNQDKNSEDSFGSVPEAFSDICEEEPITISLEDEEGVHCMSSVLTTEILEEQKVMYKTSPPCMANVSFYYVPPFILMLYSLSFVFQFCPINLFK